MARKDCLFCGGKPVTKEHVIPDWLGGVMARGKPQPSAPDRVVKMVNERGKDDITSEKWLTDKGPHLTSRCVCGPCNGGWMSDIESAATWPLTEMIEGRSVALALNEQEAVATWLALRAIVEQHSRSEPPPAGWGKRFYATKRPPTEWQVRIGEYGGTGWAVRFTGVSIDVVGTHPLSPFAVRFPGFLFTALIGQFVGQVIGLDQRADLTPNRLYFTEIWPHPLLRVTDTPIGTGANPIVEAWPPNRRLDESQLKKATKDVKEPRPALKVTQIPRGEMPR